MVSVSSLLLLVGTRVRHDSEKRESMSVEDAKMFPVFGSAALLTLFFALKYIPKDILNKVFSVLFAITGVVSVYKALTMAYTETVRYLLRQPRAAAEKPSAKEAGSAASQPDAETKVASQSKSKDHPVAKPSDHPVANQEQEKPAATATLTTITKYLKNAVAEAKTTVVEIADELLRFPNIIFFGVAVGINALYVKSRGVILGNVLAASFAVVGLQEIKPDSTHTVLLLLALLFVYDIFWVFCTPVMIGVAKGLDFPIKIVCPFRGRGASMIGLGDIVIPGLYLGVARDFADKQQAPWVFRLGFIGYVLSLIVTFGVVLFFQAGQPALLYICPLITGSTILGAYLHRKTQAFVAYTT